jgi:hypothetical protein
MICSAKPILTEDSLIVQKEEYYAICAIRTLDESPSILIRDKPVFSSQRMYSYIRIMIARVQLK